MEVEPLKGFVVHHKRVLSVVVVLIVLIAGLYHSTVAAVNHVTSNDPAQYVTNQTCGYMDTPERDNVYVECPDQLRCFHIQEHEKPGVDTPRCVEPGFVENRCGYFEGYITLLSMPAEFGGCGVLDGPLEVLKKMPGGITAAWNELRNAE